MKCTYDQHGHYFGRPTSNDSKTTWEEPAERSSLVLIRGSESLPRLLLRATAERRNQTNPAPTITELIALFRDACGSPNLPRSSVPYLTAN